MRRPLVLPQRRCFIVAHVYLLHLQHGCSAPRMHNKGFVWSDAMGVRCLMLCSPVPGTSARSSMKQLSVGLTSLPCTRLNLFKNKCVGLIICSAGCSFSFLRWTINIYHASSLQTLSIPRAHRLHGKNEKLGSYSSLLMEWHRFGLFSVLNWSILEGRAENEMDIPAGWPIQQNHKMEV